MTQKNMHGLEGHAINTEVLEVITDEQGNPRTTWDVFKQMARYYKKENPNKDYLPVEEWESGFTNDEGQIVYTGEIKHEKDFLSMFIEMEEKTKRERFIDDISNNGELRYQKQINNNAIKEIDNKQLEIEK